jgi:HK97 family phage major capsid protein
MTFSVVNFGAFKFSSDSVLVSEELLQDSAFDLNTFIGASTR